MHLFAVEQPIAVAVGILGVAAVEQFLTGVESVAVGIIHVGEVQDVTRLEDQSVEVDGVFLGAVNVVFIQSAYRIEMCHEPLRTFGRHARHSPNGGKPICVRLVRQMEVVVEGLGEGDARISRIDIGSHRMVLGGPAHGRAVVDDHRRGPRHDRGEMVVEGNVVFVGKLIGRRPDYQAAGVIPETEGRIQWKVVLYENEGTQGVPWPQCGLREVSGSGIELEVTDGVESIHTEKTVFVGTQGKIG